MSAPLKGKKLAQVAFVVRDIEAAKTRWAKALGVEPPSTIVTRTGQETRMTFRGLPSDAQCKLAFFDLGGVQLELIEPMGGASSWQEGLDQDGEGFHHIAFWTENMGEDAVGLSELGVALYHRGDMGEKGQFAYFDGRSALASTIELLENERTSVG